MRLFEAIIDANHRALGGDRTAGIHPTEFADELPIVALTCIDPRLNPLIPEVLGVPEENFVWLRNAGNIITGPLSSTMRSLALACAVKGGKEIAILGHTDCLVCKTTMMRLTDALRALGVDRARLPENITEFFGLSGSERQNVIKACDIVRSSPLIGPKVPVHGLLVDIQDGRLEWLVNGYQTLSATTSEFDGSLKATMHKAADTLGHFEDFKIGEMKFPDTKIGQQATHAGQVIQEIREVAAAHPQAKTPAGLAAEVAKDFVRYIVLSQFYKVIGNDKQQYGPISGEKLLQWLAEERVNPQTPVQLQGRSEWVPLEKLGQAATFPPIPVPPPLRPKSGARGTKG